MSHSRESAEQCSGTFFRSNMSDTYSITDCFSGGSSSPFELRFDFRLRVVDGKMPCLRSDDEDFDPLMRTLR